MSHSPGISKTRLAKLASVTIRTEPEDTRIEGNASAFDRVTDNETNAWIHAELAAGNEWAWCRVVVTATYDGVEATDSLGCCSYKSEYDFRRGGYWPDMRRAALAQLHEALVERERELPLRKVEPDPTVAMSWRQAITARYQGGKISVRGQVGNALIPWDHALSTDDNYLAAVREFANRWGWSGTNWIGAQLPDGHSYAFVQLPESMST